MPLPVTGDLISEDMRFLLMSNDAKWRKLRALMQKQLTPTNSNALKPTQETKTRQLLYDILTDNEDGMQFYMHARRLTTSVMTSSILRATGRVEADFDYLGSNPGGSST